MWTQRSCSDKQFDPDARAQGMVRHFAEATEDRVEKIPVRNIAAKTTRAMQ